MSDPKPSNFSAPVSESTTITVVGPYNVTPAEALPTCGGMSYTAPSEYSAPSKPLSDGAVQLGNSLLNARVREDAIRRDNAEEF